MEKRKHSEIRHVLTKIAKSLGFWVSLKSSSSPSSGTTFPLPFYFLTTCNDIPCGICAMDFCNRSTAAGTGALSC